MATKLARLMPSASPTSPCFRPGLLSITVRNRILPGTDVVRLEGVEEVAEHGDLRAAQEIADPPVEGPIVEAGALPRGGPAGRSLVLVGGPARP